MALKEHSVPLDFVECDNNISKKGNILDAVNHLLKHLNSKGRADLAVAVSKLHSEIERNHKQTLSRTDKNLCNKGVFRCNPKKSRLKVVSTIYNRRSGFLRTNSSFFGHKYNYLAFKGIGLTVGSHLFIYPETQDTGRHNIYGLAYCGSLVKAYFFSLLFNAAAYLEHGSSNTPFPAPTFMPLRILNLKEAYRTEEDECPTPIDKIKKDLNLPDLRYCQLFYLCQDWHRLKNIGYYDTFNIDNIAIKKIISRIGYALYLAHDVLKGSFTGPRGGLALTNISVAGEMLDPDYFWSPYLPTEVQKADHECCIKTDTGVISQLIRNESILREFMKGRFPYADEGRINSFLSASANKNLHALTSDILEFRKEHLKNQQD